MNTKINNYLDNIFIETDPNIKLDNLQKKAVICDKNNQLIVAGAGSGKTTVIAAKIKYLVEIKNIDPQNILVISFTNKAILELKERINKELNINCLICTFHKFGLNIIKDYNEEEIKICSNSNEIIKNIILNNDDILLKKFYCNYYGIKGIKGFIHCFMSFKRTINKEKYSVFADFCADLVMKYKTDEIKEQKTALYKTIKYISEEYNKYLSENNMIDFADMIKKASDYIDKAEEFEYKYIIIDEYQDISKDRFKLIKKISNKFETKIIAVGDDWQSIYSFSGSEISLFTDFINIYENAELLKINNTYRNSQELIDVAGTFIMKNEKQIKKQLLSSKKLTNPIEIIKYRESVKINKLKYVIDVIINEFPGKNILILGRYKFDIKPFIDNNLFIQKNEKIKYRNSDVDITYMTVHASKGLGYDNVILINCKRGIYGFPSEKQNHKILKSLIPQNPNFQFEEERRLFYVALTRTKNKIFLLTPINKRSVFVDEIIEIIKNNQTRK